VAVWEGLPPRGALPTSGDVLHYKVEILFILEAVVKLSDPLELCLGQNITLSFNMSHLISTNHIHLRTTRIRQPAATV